MKIVREVAISDEVDVMHIKQDWAADCVRIKHVDGEVNLTRDEAFKVAYALMSLASEL